ncbi:MAG TPA: hypothetical protein VNT79_11630 [Phycisphaerae bacterium]|nr:hypothetical protein [Phycisphaerae bacterium]
MYRGKRPASDPLPRGIRQDTRWKTRHILRPTRELVEPFLESTSAEAWKQYVPAYFAVLEERFAADRKPFDDLAALAERGDVFIGCSCPTKKNPVPGRCHTYLALEFMKSKYPWLVIDAGS